MKKVLLSIASTLLIVGGVHAQSFILQSGSNDTATLNYSGSDDMSVHNDIKSTSATPVTIEWNVTGSSIGTNWVVTGPCDNVTCQDFNSIKGGTKVTTAPYDQTFGFFDVSFGNLDTVAVGSFSWVKVQMKDVAGPTTRNITFLGRKLTNKIVVTQTEDDIILFPNPARDAVNVIFDNSTNIKSVAVYNLIGRAVKVFKTTGNSAKVELNDVPSGVYFLRLMNSQGAVVATKKFNKQ